MFHIETEFASYDFLFQAVEVLGLAFLIALVSEAVWDVLRGQRTSLKDTFANGAIALVSTVLERTAYGVIFIAGLIVVSPLAFFDIPNGWWLIPLAILVADFTYYWMHRCEHRVRLFWANHSVHHSSEEFNFSTSLRISWMDAIIEWVFFVPMVLVGFSVVETVVGLVVVVAYQSWIHTDKVRNLGWLEYVFNTPSAHRVHHGSNRQYLDKNYGGILIVWDRLFGTYEPENADVEYGLTEPVASHNPLTINFHEYKKLLGDMRRAETFKASVGYLFNPPGWRPQLSKSKRLPEVEPDQ